MRVFDGLGSWEAMMAWAKDNPDIFYGQVMPKLLPRDQDMRGIGNITVIVQRNPEVSIPNQLTVIESDASVQIVQAEAQASNEP